MDNKVRCPFCGSQMIETENIGFKSFEEVTDEMLEEYEAGEGDHVFYTMICEECGAQSPQFDTEGEAVAFMYGFNERMREGDETMTMNEYQQLAQRTINEKLDANEKMMHALHGMASEVGEIHGIYQKSYQGHEIDGRELQKELGDLLWFVAEFCTAAEWSLGYIAHKNIEKLRRRYPEGFDAERSINREE